MPQTYLHLGLEPIESDGPASYMNINAASFFAHVLRTLEFIKQQSEWQKGVNFEGGS